MGKIIATQNRTVGNYIDTTGANMLFLSSYNATWQSFNGVPMTLRGATQLRQLWSLENPPQGNYTFTGDNGWWYQMIATQGFTRFLAKVESPGGYPIQTAQFTTGVNWVGNCIIIAGSVDGGTYNVTFANGETVVVHEGRCDWGYKISATLNDVQINNGTYGWCQCMGWSFMDEAFGDVSVTPYMMA